MGEILKKRNVPVWVELCGFMEKAPESLFEPLKNFRYGFQYDSEIYYELDDHLPDLLRTLDFETIEKDLENA